MSFAITDSVTWMGKKDWELRTFHGEEYSTHRGSTYNSYLVRDEKTVLVDTVWGPFADEYLAGLAAVVELSAIDAVVAAHAEPDHSGALPALMNVLKPGTPLYCSKNGLKSFRGHYHQDWNFQPVQTGDRLSLGGKELIFVEASMLHWPDTLFCYLTGDAVLFSNDGFGQHLASEGMYNDLVDQCELFQECLKYYANILTPFSRQVEKKIREFADLNLPLNMICPSHGVIWRQNPMQIVGKYLEWAADYQENQVTLLYDSMWHASRRMAEAIARGVRTADPTVTVKLYNTARSDKNDVITEVFKSKGVLVGSPTINRGILFSIAGILEEMRGLQFKRKKAAAFGSYGWSGEGVKIITERLKEGGFEVVNDGLRAQWNPDAAAVGQCEEFGRRFVQAL